MRQIWLYLFLINVLTSCDSHITTLCEEDVDFKVYDFDGLQVYGSIEDGLTCAKARKQPVFLLFSGFACVGDRSYERQLFVEKINRSIIEKNYIPVILYVDDKEQLEKEFQDTIIVNEKRIVIKEVGKKNSLYQQQIFRSNTQPLLVVLDHFGNQIIESIGYQGEVSKYTDFLERGIEQYRQLKEDIYVDVNLEHIDTNDYLIRVPNESYELGMPFKFVNKNNETIIEENQFGGTYTDTLKTIAIVYKGQELIGVNRKGQTVFDVFEYDNGPDYIQDGLFRIKRNGKIGYADRMGNIVIPCQFECAYPFGKGIAKVSKKCQEIRDFEHGGWESDEWYLIDRNGKKKYE